MFFATIPSPPVNAATPVLVSICVADHRIGTQIEIVKGNMPNKTFPWLEACTEKHRARNVDLNVGIIYNYSTLIPFVIKIRLPLLRILVRILRRIVIIVARYSR